MIILLGCYKENHSVHSQFIFRCKIHNTEQEFYNVITIIIIIIIIIIIFIIITIIITIVTAA